MADRKTRQHGNGISSRWLKRQNRWVFSVQYYWNGKRITETVPETYQRATGRLETRKTVLRGHDAAKALRADREKQRYLADWMPPHLEAKIEKQRQAEAEKDREPLLYENAVERFLDECGDEYSNPDGARGAFERLQRFYGGRHLDAVTRVDVRQYFLDRTTNSGPFADWPRQVSIRAAEIETTYLSALYTWLQDSGFAVENPCHRPRSRRKDSPLAPYRPKRQKMIPEPATIRAIFAAEKTGGNGRQLVRTEHRALFKLVYYTAARPQSEPCRLTHGDVRFFDDGWGEVNYRNTKNAASVRTLPLHPEAVSDLRATMLPEPIKKTEREEWRDTPIFRKHGSLKPMDQYSYRKAWRAAISEIPEAEGMVLRDFRATARTVMTQARIPEPVIRRFLGHSVSVSESYFEPTIEDLREAADALALEKVAAVLAAGHERA